jgi:signal transduction protein with GAF and PtsI domain
MLDLVADMVSKTMDAAGCCIYLEDTATRRLALEGGTDMVSGDAAESGNPRGGLASAVFERGKPISLNSGEEAAELKIGANLPCEGYPCAFAPVRAGERVIGVIGVEGGQRHPRAFEHEEIALLVALADRLGVAFDRATCYESARNQLVSVMESIKWVLEARGTAGEARPEPEASKATN